jgi:hypothetical protein
MGVSNRWADPRQMPAPGYWYGSPPKAGGTGSMIGPSGTVQAGKPAGRTWHPTVVNLLILVSLEILAYGLLRYAFRTVHGG